MTTSERSASDAVAPSGQPYALRAERVFDGRRMHGPSVVLVDGGRITGVQPGDEPLPFGLATVDLGPGRTLLPGLVDAHVHLVFDASPAAAEHVQQVSDDELADQMRQRARSMLEVGVTTVRDLGDRRYLSLPLRDELAARPDAGPTLLCAGPPITTKRGHCWFLGGEVDSDADLRAAVAERASRGVDVVKVMATGGEMTPGSHGGLVQFDEAALGLIVRDAHRYGLPVAAHAHAPAGVANALAAGVDTIEHCSFMTADDVAADEDTIAALAASGMVASLTLGIVPTDVPPPPKLIALMPKLIANVRRMFDAGVVVTLGSDAGIGPPKPHHVLPYCVVALADLTGDNLGALAAATSVAARANDVADCKGTLAPGYAADLLVVDGDPSADIRALHEVAAVYRMGTQVAGAHSAPAAPRLSP